MSSEQATATQPAQARRGGAFLEENGLVVIVLGAFAIVLVLALRKDLVIDGWMALVSGRWIAHHGLPTHDVLTVWTHGRRWGDQQWLPPISLYGVWRVGGVKLVLLIHALFVMSGLVGAALIARSHGATP